MRGAKPIPTPIRVLMGNPSKRPLPKDEPVPPEGEIVCPAWLHGRAREIWAELQPVLLGMRVLTTADVPMLAILCATQAEFIEATLDVEKRGIQVKRTRVNRSGKPFYTVEDNPSVRIASDAGKRAKALMVEFGMSASSRTRVTVAPKVVEEDPFSQFERNA